MAAFCAIHLDTGAEEPAEWEGTVLLGTKRERMLLCSDCVDNLTYERFGGFLEDVQLLGATV